MKTKSKKILYAVIAMSVACFLACSALLVIGRVDRGGEPAASAPAENGGMLIGESEGAGVSLLSEKIAKADYAAYGVSPLADSAYTLTATVEPANAADKAVDWSVAFVNPSSSWATGKTVTDYVTVTPTSDGALTATVQNLKAFGEQIKVTVTLRQNEEVSADCTVDYIKKVQNILYTLKNTTTNETKSFTFGDEKFLSFITTDFSNDREDTITPNYTPFTINDTFDIKLEIILNTALLDELKSTAPELNTTWNKITKTSYQEGSPDPLVLEADIFMFGYFSEPDDNSGFVFWFDFVTKWGSINNAYKTVMDANPEMHIYTAKITATGTYSTYEAETKIDVDRSLINYYVDNITLDETSIKF